MKVKVMWLMVAAMMVACSFQAGAQTLSMEDDAYYEWTETASQRLHKGVTYTAYSWVNVPRRMHVLEIDLTTRGLDIVPVVADDIIPNPNGNRNRLNGYCIRETLSQICSRYNSEGIGIVAGVNGCGFDSHLGYARGLIVSDGELIYQNYPKMRDENYGYKHTWSFAVFQDRTAAAGQKEFEGRIRMGKEEIAYDAVNDYILRGDEVGSPVNIYTSRYREVPHDGLVNPLLDSAVVYVVAEYVHGPMKVNCGYSKARVRAVYDGRYARLDKAPYLDSPDQVGIQLRGEAAERAVEVLETGDMIALRADVTVGGIRKPIKAMISTMNKFLEDGVDRSKEHMKPNDSNLTTHNPMTFVTISKDGRKVWLIEVDGRRKESLGLKSREMVGIAKKLGGWNLTRFDGGGSSSMWVRDCGGLVSMPSDKKGERSCLNYLLLRVGR
jgi:exopolysaccharide biosynthesis protein